MKRRKEFRKPYGQVRGSAAPVMPASRSASNELASNKQRTKSPAAPFARPSAALSFLQQRGSNDPLKAREHGLR